MILQEYFTLLLALYSSVFFGMLLGFIAPEELRAARSYLKWGMRLLAALSAGFLLWHTHLNIVSLLITVGFGLLLYFRDDEQAIVFYLMGFVVYGSLGDTTILIVESALVFLFGMLSAVFYLIQYEKKESLNIKLKQAALELLIKYIPFIVVGLIPYWFF